MTTFRAQTIYRVFAVASLAVAALFGWDLLQHVEAGSLLFFAVGLGLLAWSARAALTTVTLTLDQLIVSVPPGRPRAVDYGQMLSVTEEGRMRKSIVVAYYPRTEDSLLDLERAHTLVLPAMNDQDMLYEQLVQRTPA